MFEHFASSGKRVLPSLAESLANKAAARLEKLGVKVVTGAMVEHIGECGVTVGGKRLLRDWRVWGALQSRGVTGEGEA